MVGSREDLSIDYAAVAEKLLDPRVRQDLAPFGMDDPVEILDCYLAGAPKIRAWTEGLPIQEDDRHIILYETAYSRGRRMKGAVLNELRSPVTPRLADRERLTPDVRGRLARAYEAQGFVIAGRLERAVALWPEGKKIRLFKAEMERTEDYHRAKADLYRDNPAWLLKMGTDLAGRGYAESAQAFLEAVLKRVPGHRKATIVLGNLLVFRGRPDRAEEMLIPLHEAFPGDARVAAVLGLARLTAGKPRSAVPLFRHARDLDASLTERVAFSLGQAHSQIGDLEAAEESLKICLEVAPWQSAAWQLRATIASARNRVDLAEEYLKRAIQVDPYQADAYVRLGVLRHRQGRTQEALASYHQALRIHPDSSEALINQGVIYMAARHYEQALKALRRAHELVPRSRTITLKLALCYEATGNIDEASRLRRHAQTLQETVPGEF
jgi:tetratricopeptide (TPR) repeat protein